MVVPESEGHHSFSHSLKVYLLRVCYIPGTILSPREAYIPSLMELPFWQKRHVTNKEYIQMPSSGAVCYAERELEGGRDGIRRVGQGGPL